MVLGLVLVALVGLRKHEQGEQLMATKQDLIITKGKTLVQVVRWEEKPLLYKAITAISQAAPARITVVTSGIPDGWLTRVESVKGMTQINSPGAGIKLDKASRDAEWIKATVIDANTIELNDINALEFKPYTSGGVIKFFTPANLAGLTGRMTIKNKVGGTVIASTEGVSPTLIITVDNVAKTIEIAMSALATAALTAKAGVYDLEMVSVAGVVTGLIYGDVTIESEITT